MLWCRKVHWNGWPPTQIYTRSSNWGVITGLTGLKQPISQPWASHSAPLFYISGLFSNMAYPPYYYNSTVQVSLPLVNTLVNKYPRAVKCLWEYRYAGNFQFPKTVLKYCNASNNCRNDSVSTVKFLRSISTDIELP